MKFWKYDVYIEDETMIVGNQASSNKDALFSHRVYFLEFVSRIRSFEKDGDVFYITEEIQKNKLRASFFWETITSVLELGLYFQKKFRFIWKLASLAWKGKMNPGDAHLSKSIIKIVSTWFERFEEKAQVAKEALDLTDPASIDKYHFYDSILIVTQKAMRAFVKLAQDMAESKPRAPSRIIEIARI